MDEVLRENIQTLSGGSLKKKKQHLNFKYSLQKQVKPI
jgi:hypothetical protein